MNRLLTLLSLFFLCVSTLQAKDTDFITLIKNNGDTIRGYMSTFDGHVLSDSELKIKVNGENQIIDRAHIKELWQGTRKYVVIEYSIQKARGNSVIIEQVRRLAELKVDGRVKLYTSYDVETQSSTGPNGSYIGGRKILIAQHFLSDKNKTKMFGSMGFKGVIKEFFPACKELQEKIKTKELKYEDMIRVVREGNACL